MSESPDEESHPAIEVVLGYCCLENTFDRCARVVLREITLAGEELEITGQFSRKALERMYTALVEGDEKLAEPFQASLGGETPYQWLAIFDDETHLAQFPELSESGDERRWAEVQGDRLQELWILSPGDPLPEFGFAKDLGFLTRDPVTLDETDIDLPYPLDGKFQWIYGRQVFVKLGFGANDGGDPKRVVQVLGWQVGHPEVWFEDREGNRLEAETLECVKRESWPEGTAKLTIGVESDGSWQPWNRDGNVVAVCGWDTDDSAELS